MGHPTVLQVTDNSPILEVLRQEAVKAIYPSHLPATDEGDLVRTLLEWWVNAPLLAAVGWHPRGTSDSLKDNRISTGLLPDPC